MSSMDGAAPLPRSHWICASLVLWSAAGRKLRNRRCVALYLSSAEMPAQTDGMGLGSGEGEEE